MWRFALIPLFGMLLVQGAPANAGDTECVRASPGIHAWISEHLTDDQETRDQTVSQIDGILLRSGDAADTACLLKLRMQRVLLTNTSDEYAETVETTGQMLASRVLGDFPDVEANARNARGIALGALGRAVEAKQEFLSAAALVPRLPAARAALILVNLAEEVRVEGDWILAEQSYGRALRILSDSSAANPEAMRAQIGRVYAGYAYYLQQRTATETDPDRRARLAHRVLIAADSSITLLNLGVAKTESDRMRRQGKTALALIDGAYAEAVLGNHDAAARRIGSAEARITPAVQALFPYALTDLWLRRAETEQMAGRLEAASEAAERSRSVCRETEDVTCEADALERLAQISEQRGLLADAERQFRRATHLRDIEWEQGRLQDWSASAFATAQVPYRLLTRVLVRQGRTEEAFAILDGARARTLRDMRERLSARDGLTPEGQVLVDSLLEALASERLASLADTASTEAQLLHTRHISQINARLDAATRSQEKPVRLLAVPRLQRALERSQRTLVSYLVQEDETIVFVVTPDTLVARMLPTTKHALVSTIQDAGGPWAPAGSGIAVRMAPLHTLHEWLIRPIREWIPEKGSLVVIPDGVLADVPFGTLLEAPADDYASARFLVRQHPISTDLAAALLIEDDIRSEPSYPLDVLAFGRSRFGGGSEAPRERGGAVMASLPNVVTEIGRIRRRIGNHETALNEDATEERFATDAVQARVLHLASHAEAGPLVPALLADLPLGRPAGSRRRRGTPVRASGAPPPLPTRRAERMLDRGRAPGGGRRHDRTSVRRPRGWRGSNTRNPVVGRRRGDGGDRRRLSMPRWKRASPKTSRSRPRRSPTSTATPAPRRARTTGPRPSSQEARCRSRCTRPSRSGCGESVAPRWPPAPYG